MAFFFFFFLIIGFALPMRKRSSGKMILGGVDETEIMSQTSTPLEANKAHQVVKWQTHSCNYQLRSTHIRSGALLETRRGQLLPQGGIKSPVGSMINSVWWSLSTIQEDCYEFQNIEKIKGFFFVPATEYRSQTISLETMNHFAWCRWWVPHRVESCAWRCTLEMMPNEAIPNPGNEHQRRSIRAPLR